MARSSQVLKNTHRSKKRRKPQAYQSRATAEYERALQRYVTGSHGAASAVRRIDPKTGKVIEVISQSDE
jgi:hypothetical protein